MNAAAWSGSEVTEHRYAVDARNPVFVSRAARCATPGACLPPCRMPRPSTASISISPSRPPESCCRPRPGRSPKCTPATRCPAKSSSPAIRFPSGALPTRGAYRLNRLVRKYVERWVLQRCRTVVALSRFSQRRLGEVHGIPAERTTIIPGGVDTDTFRPAGDKPPTRRGLRLPTDRVVLFTVRNLVARMGLENLLLAVKAALPRAPGPFPGDRGRRAARRGAQGNGRP